MKHLKLFHLPILFSALFISCGSSVQTLDILLHCDDDCNENNAVVIKIFQLKNSDKFEHASFESLIRDPDGALGEDLIPGSKYEKTMIPGEDFQLDKVELKTDAAFLGIIGDFNSPAKNGWMDVVPVNSDVDNVKILIHKNFLSAIKEE
ncbi:MAG TPA: type VI secretion system lipoprotein TssJ [Ignavibacteriaceae bacterium]|nr:type VI secretion system lipoprotein TssJ [Ignavibacteriaceae bacterium]